MADLPGFPTGDGAAFIAQPGTGLQTGGIYTYNAADPYFNYAPTVSYWGQAAPAMGIPGPAATSTSTGVNPTETSYSLYGHTIPLSVFGVGRIGGEIISGPWVSGGAASFCISFGVPADPAGTRDLREIAFDSEVVWSTNGATGVTTAAGGTFTTEAFTFRFYQGTLTQTVDSLETTHFGASAVAYRPQMLLWFENLPLAATKFRKIPYVAAVIGDGSGDDVNYGEAFERLAYSPWVGWTSAKFETSGITDGVTSGGLIIAQDSQFLQLIQQFGRFYPKWNIIQTDKLRVTDRGAIIGADIELDRTRLTGATVISRAEPNSVPKLLELSTIDPDSDYTIIPSRAQTPQNPVAVTTSVKTESVYLPVIMDASTRASVVTYTKYHEEVTRKKIQFTAMAYGLEIEPGDLVAVTGLGADFGDEVFRVIETLHGANYTVEITAESILRCDFGTTADVHLGEVVLLMGFEGVDASTGAPGFTDESPAAQGTGTAIDAAQIDTAFSKFGSSSLLLNGTGGGLFTPNDGILFADSDDWTFGAGEYTVEAWIRPTTVAGGQRFIVAQWMASAPLLAWTFYQQGTQLGWSDTVDGSTPNHILGGTLAVNTWQHVAADYDGTKRRIYLNGVMVASDIPGARTLPNITAVLSIGVNGSLTAFCFNGNIDEVRVTKGVARYATDTSFTVPTAAFPRI